MDISEAILLSFELWGLMFLFLEIVLIAVSYKADQKRAKNLAAALILCIVMNLSNAVTHFPGIDPMVVRVCYFITFASMYHLIACAADYNRYLVGVHKSMIIVNILSIVETLILIVSLFTGWIYVIDDNGDYHVGPYYWVTRSLVIVSLLIELVIILINRKNGDERDVLTLTIDKIFLITVMVLQIVFSDATLLPIAFTICAVLQFMMYEVSMTYMLRDDEKKLNEERVSMIKARVKPHFIFNSLTTIRSLIRRDGDEAIAAIDEFSDYLRASIEVLNESAPVPLSEEIETTEHYLSLQKRRFGKKLDYEFIIKDDDFSLPAFSIQTLVENAVSHGIRNKPNGGKVTVRTYYDGVYHIVEIEDDGVGFDPAVKPDDNRTHVGLQNTKDRVLIMCGGKIEIDSKIGAGTLVRIEIPGGVNKI